MIASLMLYGVAIATLFSLAALATERALRALELPRRSVWLVAILASIVLPVVVALDRREPVAFADAASAAQSVGRGLDAMSAASYEAAVPEVSTFDLVAPRMPDIPALDTILAGSWLLLSIGFFLFYAAGWRSVRRAAKSWRIETIHGHEVNVSDCVGPAVMGFLRPRIVVPRWLLAAPRSAQQLVIQHERQHIESRDQLALLFGLAVVGIAPWNLPLWWQLRRLRFSIEVDCDSRLVRNGVDPLAYGDVLLQVGRQYLRAPAGAVALTEPPSDIERRIRLMMIEKKRSTTLVVGCLALCVSLVGAAAQIDPPAVESTDLRLPAPQSALAARVQALVHTKYPELFASALEQPVLVKMTLNNDLTLEWAEKKVLAVGTTHDEAAAREAPREAFDQRFGMQEPRVLGRLLLQSKPGGEPVYLEYAARIFSKTRSAAAVEPVLMRTFPHLYDDASDGDVLLIALLNDDGTVERSIKRQRKPGESVVGENNQFRALAELKITADDIGTPALLPSRQQAPFKPAVLYAFRKADNTALDADPRRAADPATIRTTQRALIERHFPQIAAGSSNPHQLLWLLLDQTGNVMASGRDAAAPDALMSALDSRYPGASAGHRITAPLSTLFDTEMNDVQGQPLLATFVWLDDEQNTLVASAPVTPSIQLEATIFRNGELVGSIPLVLQAGGASRRYEVPQLRMDISVLELSNDLLDLGVVIQVPLDRKGVEYAEGWETIAKPMLRTKLGQKAIIEQGVRSPDDPNGAIWKVELGAQRTQMTSLVVRQR